MNLTFVLVFAALLILQSVDARGRGGGGGRGGGSRGGSSSRGSSRGSSGSRSTSRWGTGGSKTMSGRSRTSIYGRNIGGYSGKSSVNSNGFGFGLGVGMFLGYRTGMLARPYGYNSGHTYRKEHDGEEYHQREDGLIECAVSDTVMYIKKRSEDQDVETEEDSKVCNSGEDICFGILQIAEVTATLDSGSTEELLEVRVKKGCGTKSDFVNGPKGIGTYDPERMCWTTNVTTEAGISLADKGKAKFNLDTDQYVSDGSNSNSDNTLVEVTVFDFSSNEGMKKEFEWSSGLSSNGPLKFQQETCICGPGDLCNGGMKLESPFTLLILVAVFIQRLL